MNTATLNIVAQYNTVRGNRWWSINDGKASSWRWLHNGTLDIVGVCLARSTPKSSHTQHHTDDVMWVFRLAAYTSRRLLGAMVLYAAQLMVYLSVCLSTRHRLGCLLDVAWLGTWSLAMYNLVGPYLSLFQYFAGHLLMPPERHRGLIFVPWKQNDSKHNPPQTGMSVREFGLQQPCQKTSMLLIWQKRAKATNYNNKPNYWSLKSICLNCHCHRQHHVATSNGTTNSTAVYRWLSV